MKANRPLRAKRRLLLLGLGLLTLAAFHAMARDPGLVEVIYGEGLGPWLIRPASLLLGPIPFAVAEFAVVGYASLFVFRTIRGLTDVRRGRRTPGNAMAVAGLVTARDAGVLLTLFYVLWGFNYARAPLSERLGWPEWAPPEQALLESLTDQAVQAANSAYREIHRSDDAGAPTDLPPDLRELDDALEVGWQRAAEGLGLHESVGRHHGPVKRLLLTPLVARFGVAGFYFPWTGEANTLANSPAVTRAQSTAHEKAHQRGIGPESEASFLGFVAGSRAPHAHARYSAYVFAQGQLLNALASLDRDAAQALMAKRLPGIRRDLDDQAAYWRRYRGTGTRVGRAVNDRFLRANRVSAGTASYGLSVRLLIAFGAQNGGVLQP